MYVSARADYALRALLQIAASAPDHVTMSDIVSAQTLPRSFAEAILPDLRRADFLRVWRGRIPNYSLSRPATEITIGSVIRAMDGELTRVRGLPPEEVSYHGAARPLAALWLTTSAALDRLFDSVTLADVLESRLPMTSTDLGAGKHDAELRREFPAADRRDLKRTGLHGTAHPTPIDKRIQQPAAEPPGDVVSLLGPVHAITDRAPPRR